MFRGTKTFKISDIEFKYDNFLICNINVLEQQLGDLETKTWKDNVGNYPQIKVIQRIRTGQGSRKVFRIEYI